MQGDIFIMKIKFSITLLALSMLFLFSCGQDEAGNKDIVVTKKEEPNKFKWATKTQPDGTILRRNELKELSDGRTVQSKPEGWEWDDRPVTRPSHIEEFQQDPGWEEGPNIFKRQDGTKKDFLLAIIYEIILKESEDYSLLTKANDWSVINIEALRCDSYRTLLEYLSTENQLPDVSRDITKDKTNDKESFRVATKAEVAGTLVNRTVNGNSVEINVSSISLDEVAEIMEELEGGMKAFKDDSSFKDQVVLFIKINDDSLKISCEMKAPSEGKDYIFWAKTTTTIKGENYGSSSDFFKKLSELNIVTVRTLDTEEYNLYFALPL